MYSKKNQLKNVKTYINNGNVEKHLINFFYYFDYQ